MENRRKLGTVSFKRKFIDGRYLDGAQGAALNCGRVRLLRYHQQQW